MQKPHKGRNDNAKQIAQERIAILLEQAKQIYPQYPDYAKKYIALALKIQQRYKVKLDAKIWREICKKCANLRKLGKNTKIEVDSKNKSIVYICSCGAKKRFFYSKKRQ